MKRFLSILMLLCMLLSLALPAAAGDGKLYALVTVGNPDNNPKFPDGVFRDYRFLILGDEGEYVDVPGPIIPYVEKDGTLVEDHNTVDISGPDSSGFYRLTGKKPGNAVLTYTNPEDDSDVYKMTVEVVEAKFEVGTRTGSGEWINWDTSLDVQVDVTANVAFRWGAEGIYNTTYSSDPKFSITQEIKMPEGLTYANNRLTASAPNSSYTVTCSGKTVTISASSVSAEIADWEQIKKFQDNQTEFDDFLTSKNYKKGEPFTLLLPPDSPGESIDWNVSLPDNAVLTMQGSSDTSKPSTIPGLTISSGTLCLDKVTLTGDTGVTLKEGSGNFTARNCTFNNTVRAFQLTFSDTKALPLLTLLSGNTFTSPKAVVDGAGTWTFTQGDKAVDLNLRVGIGTKNGAEKDTKVVFPVYKKTEEITIATEDAYAAGWDLKFTTGCVYTNSYFVYYDEGLGQYILLFDVPDFPTTLSLDKDNSQLTLSSPVSGEYLCVNGEGPVLKETNATTRTLVLTEDQAKYVQGVLMKSPFKSAMVNDNKVDSVQYSSGLLNFDTKTKGTYIIKEVKLPAEEAKVATRLYTISTKDVYPIYHANFMNTLRLTRDGNVKINCKEAGKRAIGIPVESLEAAASKGMTVTLNAKNYSLLLDVAALKSLAQQAKGDRVILQYRSLNHKTMSNVGMASVTSHLEQYPNHVADLAFLVSATSDNESIVDLQMGTVTLTVPFIVLPGTEGYPNENFALMTETESQARKTEVADGNLITVLTDLTEHMVFLEMPVEETVPETTEAPTEPETIPETTEAPTEPPVQVEPEESKGFPIWIPLVLVALAGGGAAVWFLFLRKRKKAAE